jgi:hypothetical protein
VTDLEVRCDALGMDDKALQPGRPADGAAFMLELSEGQGPGPLSPEVLHAYLTKLVAAQPDPTTMFNLVSDLYALAADLCLRLGVEAGKEPRTLLEELYPTTSGDG